MDRSRTRRRRVLSHQCHECQQMWALRLVEGREGRIVQCRFCGAARRALPSQPAPEERDS